MSSATQGATSKEDFESSQLDEHQQWEEKASPATDFKPSEELNLDQGGVHANARVTGDGRLDVTIDGNKQSLDQIFGPLLEDLNKTSLPQEVSRPSDLAVPTLNIVVHVVGSRGDVQPFVALGRTLKKNGHRVRLATHPTFKKFVEENELEFFSIGGDPAELMAFMVKNPGLLPGIESLRAGDVGRRRKEMNEIIDGCWRSCIEAGNGLSDFLVEELETDASPFIADAIIANPPSFAHIHCSEKLQIPLHIMFTMPWSPTKAFLHPLANMLTSSANPNMANYLSYALVETMTWQGLGDLINRFRVEKLGLGEIDPTFAPGMLSRLRIPHTYAWSPALIPKPEDWGGHLSISGFFFLSLASAYTPPEDLAAFLSQGPPPVYIGFGSIVVDDPDALTALILEAVQKTGVRALVSKGWGGLGSKKIALPENVFMLGNCPHDWLFPRVSCVVHHGGAGTMAAGIASGKPTVIVPFFGDQPFWGDMVARAGAGPTPIPYKELTADRLGSALIEALQPTMTERAIALGSSISEEQGTETGASSFYSQLPIAKMHCSILQGRIAVWRVAKSDIHLSAMAAGVLSREGLVEFDDLRLYGPCDHHTDHGASDPLSASFKVGYGMISDLLSGFSDVSRGMYKSMGPKSKDVSAAGDLPGNVSSTAPDEPTRLPSLTKAGLLKLGAVPLKTTMDLTASMAQGLHNAPKLYGDRTVRAPEKISGWQSGLKAAGKELGLGVYDGFSGLVTLPIKGHKEEGEAGIYKGIGKGLGGLIFKPLSGVSGFFGFTFKGIYKEIQKKYGTRVDGYLRAARMAQGYDEASRASVEECAVVLERWQELQQKKGKTKGKK